MLLKPFDDSEGLNDSDGDEEVQEPIEVRMSRKLDELRKEKHKEYIRLRQNEVMTGASNNNNNSNNNSNSNSNNNNSKNKKQQQQ